MSVLRHEGECRSNGHVRGALDYAQQPRSGGPTAAATAVRAARLAACRAAAQSEGVRARGWSGTSIRPRLMASPAGLFELHELH